MTEARSFLQEINEAILHGSPESRARALWHATDLLIAGRYTEDQIWVFGEVIERLADEIEVAARAQLSKRLAPSDNAPVKVVKKLAFDDSIDVAMNDQIIYRDRPDNWHYRTSPQSFENCGGQT